MSSGTITPTKTPSRSAMEIQRESSINRLLNENSLDTSSSNMGAANDCSNATDFTKSQGEDTLTPSTERSGYSNAFLLHYVVENSSPDAIVDPTSSPPLRMRNTKAKKAVGGTMSISNSMLMDAVVTPKKRNTNTTVSDGEQSSHPARKIKLIHNGTDNASSAMLLPSSGNRTSRRTAYARSIKALSTTKRVSLPNMTAEADQVPENDQSPDPIHDEDDQADHPDERKGISGRELVASGMGTSTEPALIAPIRDKKTGERHKVLSAPWRCGERHCNTGQTWYLRQAVGRKCVSQYFGRNKKETNSIPGDVWNFHCRKHYQRESYSRQFLDTTQKIIAEVNGLRSQVDRLRLWRPDAKFKIQLTKAVHDRLQVFQTAYRRYEGTEDDARIAGEEAWKKKFNVVDERKMQPADKFHPILAEEFGTANLEQEAGSYQDIDRVLEWILTQAQSGRLTVIPPFELLILPKEDGEAENETCNNYERYMYDVVDKNEGFKETQVEVEAARAVQGPHRQHARVRDTRPRPLTTRVSGEFLDGSTSRDQFREDNGSKDGPIAITQRKSTGFTSTKYEYALDDATGQSPTRTPVPAINASKSEPFSANQKSVQKARAPKIAKNPARTSPRRVRDSPSSSTD